MGVHVATPSTGNTITGNVSTDQIGSQKVQEYGIRVDDNCDYNVFTGNIVEAMRAYATGELGPVEIPLGAVDRIVAIGSDRMMQAVASARHGVLSPYLKPGYVAIGSINSPMQCMMKEVCAQCLQKHVDPATGREEFIFSCFNQDQEMDKVDFPNLNARLRQNTVQEKLSNLWLDHLMESVDLPRV